MRQLTTGIIMTLLALLVCTSTGLAQQTGVEQAEYEQKAQRVVQDSTLLIMVIEQVAEDPELRSEVIQQVTETMQEQGVTTQQPNIEAMLQDTAVQAHMQEHMRLMQALNQGQQIDPNQQQMDPAITQNPEMQREMIQMHLQCMQMMQQDTTMQQSPQQKQGSQMEHDHR